MAEEIKVSRGLLSGLRVLEIGHFVAAPFCTRLLADLPGRGADRFDPQPDGRHAAGIRRAQFRHRGMVREVDDPLFGSILHAGIVPHVPEDPGRVRWPGPAVGAHTDEVMTGLLGMRPQEIAALRTEGVLGL